MTLAVFLPNWVGDAVMATPALRALREHHPGERLLAVVRPNVAGLFEGCPWVDDTLLLSPKGPTEHGLLGVAHRLRRERVRLAVLFPNSLRTALAAWLGDSRGRVGFSRYGRSLLLTKRLEPARDRRGWPKPSPILDDYNRLAVAAGCPPPSRRMELFTTPEHEASADRVWRTARLDRYPEVVCLNPGAAFGAAKFWPAEYFTALARDLADRRGCGVLVLCGPAERELARRIAHEADRPSVQSLAEEPSSLGLTMACVRRCDLLVTTDSGPRHFGTAFDRPVLTLFGPTHIAWTETYHPKSVHLQRRVPCGPCQQRTCHLDHRCMRELTPDDVRTTAEGLLQRFPAAASRPAA